MSNELTIRHTHEDGTLIYGTAKGDGVYEIVKPYPCRFGYFPSIRMIGIRQSRDHLAERWRINKAAELLTAAGWTVTVEIDDTPRGAADVKATQAERLDNRFERLSTKAERHEREAEQRSAAADHYGQRFANGQPILVGHHSERSARVAAKRVEQNDRAAHAAHREAERAAAAANVVGREAARRERPDVVVRRIAKHQAELRQTMHNINGTRPANDWRGAYAPELGHKPATGEWLDQCNARKQYLEQRIADDEALLAEHRANGWIQLDRTTVHKGDTVRWRGAWGEGAAGALVTRVNPNSVSLDRRSYPTKVNYEDIAAVDCPHEQTTTKVALPKPATPDRERVTVDRHESADRPAPVEVDASSELFPTPPAVAARMIAAADLQPSHDILEPSAGTGSLVAAITALGHNSGGGVDAIEIRARLCDVMRNRDTGIPRFILCADFLEMTPRTLPQGTTYYDRVLMNPPFSRDVAHVTHALDWLRPGGQLVAVMSAGVQYRTDNAHENFRKLIADRGGYIEPLPADAFTVENSGTACRAVLVVIPC